MAFFTVEKRLRKDGTARYRCTVGVKKDGKYVYRENKTFPKSSMAKSWGTKRTAFIDEHGIPDSAAHDEALITVGELIDKYQAHPNITIGRSKASSLKLLQNSAISEVRLSDLTSVHIIEHCQARNAAGRKPATVAQDISYLGVVLKAASPMFGIRVDLRPFNDARSSLYQMKLISQSERRHRRPTGEEVELLHKELQKKAKTAYTGAPLGDIFMFSILTCMRIGEVCRIRTEDVNHEHRSVLVRDRKDPRKKAGNHMIVPLLGEAWDILKRQPMTGERVFPYNEKTITAMYRRVRNELGIQDLRYHDLRREGASRLFEAGFSIEDVAQVTGHRSLNLLWQVYTELFPPSLHDKFERLQKMKEEN
jgi:integrase